MPPGERRDDERFTSGEWRARDRGETEAYIKARESAAAAEARTELLLTQTVAGVSELKGSMAGINANISTLTSGLSSVRIKVDDHGEQLTNIWKRLDEGRSSWTGIAPQIVSSVLSSALIAAAVAVAMVMTRPSDSAAAATAAHAPAPKPAGP